MTKEAYPMALVTQDSLDSYIRSVNSYPMLTADEERELAERLHYKGEIDAAKVALSCHTYDSLFTLLVATQATVCQWQI